MLSNTANKKPSFRFNHKLQYRPGALQVCYTTGLDKEKHHLNYSLLLSLLLY